MPPVNDIFGEQSFDAAKPNEVIDGGQGHDTLTWDARVPAPEDNTTTLIGGAGNDTLTLKLTESQYVVLLTEVGAASPEDFTDDNGLVRGPFKQIFQGNNWGTLDSIGIRVKQWENVKIEVSADPKPICPIGDILINGGVESVSADASAHLTANGGWAITQLAGWTNGTNAAGECAGIEVWNQAGLTQLTGTGLTLNNGSSYAFETDSYGEMHGDKSVVDVLTNYTDAKTGEAYKLSFDYASRQTYGFGEHTDAFEVFFNGTSLGVFDSESASKWTHFETTVVGQAGLDKIEIKELGANDSIGSVIDNFQLVGHKPQNLLVNGSFEEATLPVDQDWAITDIAGWSNLGADCAGIEVWNQSGLTARSSGALVATGNFVIETDGWGENHGAQSVQDDYVAYVNAIEGKEYDLSFNFAARADRPESDSDSFEIWWNDAKVGTFDPTSSQEWSTANLILTGGSGLDKLEIREAGANDSYGAVIDNVQIVAHGDLYC
jgi:hypothetical protein